MRELDLLIRARYPLVHLASWEEQRLDVVLEDLARNHGKAFYTWSATQGLRRIQGARYVPPLDGTKDPVEALQAVQKLTEPSLVVLKDFHPFLNDPIVVRWIRELSYHLKTTYTTLVLLSPSLTIPTELEKEMSVLDIPLPTFDDLKQLLAEIVQVLRKNNRTSVDLDAPQTDLIVKAALGLTLSEAENAFAKAIAKDNRLDAGDVQLILDEKRQVIRKSGLLEYYPVQEGLKQIGGVENLKYWLGRRAPAFSEAARRFGLPEPKGLLLLGVQGCGKSLTAKAVAAQWSLPLLRLDVGRIFSGLVGSSEENLRRAIRVAESVAPAVLWIDEIEKGLAGMAGLGLDRQRGHRPGLRRAPDLAPGEDGARVRHRHRQPHREPAARAPAQGPLRRDLLRRPALARGAPRDLRHPPAPAQARSRGASTWPSCRAVPTTSRGRRSSRWWWRGSTTPSPRARSSSSRTWCAPSGETMPLATTMKEEIARLRQWAKSRTRPASPGPDEGEAASPASRFA